MKKFSFSLDSVLLYKNQVLNSLKNEHGKILMEVAKQEKRIAELKQTYQDLNNEFNEKNACGITVLEITMHKAYIKTLEKEIEDSYAVLESLRKKEMKKREEVIEAKKETSSIDKLKEKKMEEYRKEVQKSEELFIEEFVSNSRCANH